MSFKNNYTKHHIPIGVYIGWITVATIANVTAVLVTINWDGFKINQETWAMLVIIVAAIITILVIATRKDYAYSGVIIWALLGIYIKRSADDPIYGLQNHIANTALITILVIIITASISVFLKYYKKEVKA